MDCFQVWKRSIKVFSCRGRGACPPNMWGSSRLSKNLKGSLILYTRNARSRTLFVVTVMAGFSPVANVRPLFSAKYGRSSSWHSNGAVAIRRHRAATQPGCLTVRVKECSTGTPLGNADSPASNARPGLDAFVIPQLPADVSPRVLRALGPCGTPCTDRPNPQSDSDPYRSSND